MSNTIRMKKDPRAIQFPENLPGQITMDQAMDVIIERRGEGWNFASESEAEKNKIIDEVFDYYNAENSRRATDHVNDMRRRLTGLGIDVKYLPAHYSALTPIAQMIPTRQQMRAFQKIGDIPIQPATPQEESKLIRLINMFPKDVLETIQNHLSHRNHSGYRLLDGRYPSRFLMDNQGNVRGFPDLLLLDNKGKIVKRKHAWEGGGKKKRKTKKKRTRTRTRTRTRKKKRTRKKNNSKTKRK